MVRRIRWQILIAAISTLLVLGLMSYLALTTAAVARPLSGGTYVEGLTAPPRQLNPLVSDPLNDSTSLAIQSLIVDRLMRTGADGLPSPALAAATPEISGDGLVYTFTLRPDVTWHDGVPLTADDVLFTVRAVQGPAFTGDQTAAAVWRNVLVDAIDDHTVRCTLSAPFAPFLSLVTFPILPAHLLGDVPPEQWSSAEFSLKPIGTGPYILDGQQLTTEHALLEANPRYYGGRPLLDRIELRFYGSTEETLAALARGEINGTGFVSTGELRQIAPPRGVTRHVAPLDAYTVLTFNLRESPLSDAGLRRALALALDKDTLIADTLNGQAQRLDTPILPGWWAANDAPWPAYDAERAANTLESLGYTPGTDGVRVRDGTPLALELITDTTADRAAAAQEIARQWGQLGVRVDVQQLDPQQLEERLANHSFSMALHGWRRLGPDPDVFELWHSSRAATGRNYAGLEDEQIDFALARARTEPMLQDRLVDYATFQRRWTSLVPSITLYQPLYVYMTSDQLGGLDFERPSEVAGQPPAPLLLIGSEDRFRNVAHWFVRSAREIRGDLRQEP